MPKKRTILIVEDNELSMKLFHDLLDAHGYTTLATNDGREALPIVREHRPDLILMDLQLPGVSGLEIIKLIKEDADLKSIPVVTITADATTWDAKTMRELGCEAHLTKPITLTSFIDTIDKVFSRPTKIGPRFGVG